MQNPAITFREISIEDNSAVEMVIRTVFENLDLPKIGTAYADEETKKMAQSYQGDAAEYYVVEYMGVIVGGAGIKPLTASDAQTCELQKMYFLEAIRGKGVGRKLLQKCLNSAKKMGFTSCYLETLPSLEAAIGLYESFGFEYLDESKGATGHSSCSIYMQKEL